MISLQEPQCICDTKKLVVRPRPTPSIFTGEKLIALLPFLANLNDTLDNFDVWESEAVHDLAYVLDNSD